MDVKLQHKGRIDLAIQIAISAFCFLLAGAIGFFATAGDYKGADYDCGLCLFWGCVYGLTVAVPTYLILRYFRSIVKWWQKPAS